MGGRGFEAPKASSRDADYGVWGSVVSSPSGVWGGDPAKNGFRCFPSVTECLSLIRLS